MYKCVQSLFTFIFIVIEGQLESKDAYLYYYCSILAFAYFAWLLFLLTFDLKYEPPKEEETDGLTHEKDFSKAIEYDAVAAVET